MMDRLEVPLHFSGHCIDGHDRIAEEIRARTISAPIVAGGRTERHVQCAGLFVEREIPAPDVCSRSIFPAVVQPRFVARLAWSRHGMELPELGAGLCIVGTRVAGIAALRNLADGGA